MADSDKDWPFTTPSGKPGETETKMDYPGHLQRQTRTNRDKDRPSKAP